MWFWCAFISETSCVLIFSSILLVLCLISRWSWDNIQRDRVRTDKRCDGEWREWKRRLVNTCLVGLYLFKCKSIIVTHVSSSRKSHAIECVSVACARWHHWKYGYTQLEAATINCMPWLQVLYVWLHWNPKLESQGRRLGLASRKQSSLVI